MKESKLYEIGEWLNTQGYDIDLKDCFWMEDCIFGEHKISDIAEMLFAYEHRNDTVISDGMLSVQHLIKIHPEISREQCVLHSTDLQGKCFKCGEQIFVRESK